MDLAERARKLAEEMDHANEIVTNAYAGTDEDDERREGHDEDTSSSETGDDESSIVPFVDVFLSSVPKPATSDRFDWFE